MQYQTSIFSLSGVLKTPKYKGYGPKIRSLSFLYLYLFFSTSSEHYFVLEKPRDLCTKADERSQDRAEEGSVFRKKIFVLFKNNNQSEFLNLSFKILNFKKSIISKLPF